MNIYDFSAKNQKGEDVSLAVFKGRVMLIVNTATKCGLTPQYEALEALYKQFHDKGLEILDFPCNQFLSQAPGTDAEITEFCTLNYGTTFPRFAKVDVNGADAAPLFVWLKQQAPDDIGDDTTAAFVELVKQYTPDNQATDIKWNFGKFLIGKDGTILGRYSPSYAPEKLAADIETALAK